jgi:hypothetical protein
MILRLDLDRDIDALLKTIADAGATIGAGLRRVKVRFDAPNREPLDWTIIFFVLAPNDALPSNIRVPRRFELV